MSLVRLVFWSGMIGGWSAFFGWLIAEIALGRWANASVMGVILMAATIGMFIGGGLSLVGCLSNPNLVEIAKRLPPGLLCGLVGGFVGSGLGSGLYALFAEQSGAAAFIARVLGWMAMGTCLGVVEGIYERSRSKTIKGAIGGALGGLVGGLCFNPISNWVGSAVSSRAFAFVVLGLMIGLLVGLVQVVFKEAWLTVEKGFRPGRQLLLGRQPVTMGTGEKNQLIFIAFGAQGVEPIHVKIARAGDDSYFVEDQNSRTGTLINGRRAIAPVALRNGDLIQFGVNEVRFFESARQGGSRRKEDFLAAAAPVAGPAASQAPIAAPSPTPSPAKPRLQSAPNIAPPPAQSPTSAKPAPTVKRAGPCPDCGCLVKGEVGRRQCPNCKKIF